MCSPFDPAHGPGAGPRLGGLRRGEAARPRPRRPVRGHARPAQRHHRRRRRRGRATHARSRARGSSWSARARCAPASPRSFRAGKASSDRRLRRLVLAERQRRDDGHDLGRGVGLPRGAGHASPTPTASASCATRSIAWQVEARRRTPTGYWWSLPVVAETWDGVPQRHQRLPREAGARLRGARRAGPGPVAEGNVGGGTGMICYGFKGGIGTASRRRSTTAGRLHRRRAGPGNYGRAEQLMSPASRWAARSPRAHASRTGDGRRGLDHRGGRDRRAAAAAPARSASRAGRRSASARTGGVAGNGSGDIFIAFSTANPGPPRPRTARREPTMLPNER